MRQTQHQPVDWKNTNNVLNKLPDELSNNRFARLSKPERHPMQYQVKPFSALSMQEFYAIAKLRIAVFVVEQACAYQEIDDDDVHALHTWLQTGQEMVGYARIIEQDAAAILGRVLIHPHYRGNNWAHELVENALSVIHTRMPAKPILIDAQTHLQHFYARHGFVAVSTAFLLDNIPHVRMKKPASHAADE